MNDLPDTDWAIDVHHEPTGRALYRRITGFRLTGNNEASMTVNYEVREVDGTVLDSLCLGGVEWCDVERIRGAFNDTGTELRIQQPFSSASILPLPPLS